MRFFIYLVYAAIFLTACSPTSSKFYLHPYVADEKFVDLNSESFDPKVDIVFVVDNSGSMDTHQANLATNIGLFTSVFLKKSVVDYHIAVLTTDTADISSDCCGRFVGGIRIVDKLTPGSDQVLAKNLLVGTNGDAAEKVFDPLLLAFVEPNLSGWNAGFLRQDAALVVVFITDAEDQSVKHSDPRAVYDFLLRMKGGDKRKLMSFGAIVPSGASACRRDESDVFPRRIEKFLSLLDPTGSNIFDLCTPDFGKKLTGFADDIVKQVSSDIFLSRVPAVSTIRVTYGSMELLPDIEHGWSFNPANNSIHLGSKIDWASQPVGSRVKVHYSKAKLAEDQ